MNLLNPDQSRKLLVGALFAVLGTLLMLFQNCGENEPLGDVDSASSSTNFPYAEKMDHIAYMSCSGMASNLNRQAYFTFKVGAYNLNSGLSLNDRFFSENRNLSLAQKRQVLQQNTLFGNASMTLSVRRTDDYFTINSRGVQFFGDYVGNLATETNSNLLLANSNPLFVNNFAGNRLEESVIFSNLPESNPTFDAARLRTDLGTGSVLAVAYTKNLVDPANAIGTSATSIYGTGFRMTFGLGRRLTANYATAGNFTNGDVRVMTSVAEYNLETRTNTNANWICDSRWSFMIVAPNDAATQCPGATSGTDPVPGDAIEAQSLNAIRAVLPSTLWGVNLARRCVVPLTGAAPGVCYSASANYSGPTCLQGNGGSCPHYVSVCKRN